MTLRYVSTCAGGNHHTFFDDQTQTTRVLDTEELRDQRIEKETESAEYARLEAVLPAALKAEVEKPRESRPTEPVGESEIKGAK